MPSKSIPSNHWKLNAFYNQTFNATMKLLKQSRVPTTELFQSPAKSMILKALLQKPVCKKLILSIKRLRTIMAILTS